jgi:hypothetical protein
MKLIYFYIITIVLVLAAAASIVIPLMENFNGITPRSRPSNQSYTAQGQITGRSRAVSKGPSGGVSGSATGGGRSADSGRDSGDAGGQGGGSIRSMDANIARAAIANIRARDELDNPELQEACLRDYQECVTNRFYNKPLEYDDLPEVW